MFKKTRNAFLFAREFGVKNFIIESCHRAYDAYQEHRFRIDTKGLITKESLGISTADSIDYVPIRYRAIYAILRKLPGDRTGDVFLDYGAGKGRAVSVAATFPFERVIGIELSEQLAQAAKKNIDRMRCKKARAVEIQQRDAMEYRVPCDVNVIYFFNPFKGAILQRVVTNIYSSYRENPRRIYILFFNNNHFETIVRGQSWLTKIYQTTFFPYSCGIYETASPRFPVH